MFLDMAEFRAQRRQDIRMRDWEAYLDKFLRETELPVLDHAGKVSREDALAWAGEQYEAFEQRRRLEAEAEAEARYLDDLRGTAQVIETQRKKIAKPKTGKAAKRKKGAGREV